MPQRVQTLRSSTKKQRPTTGTREVGELFVNFPDLQIGVIDPGKVAVDLVAVRFFSATTDYVAGDFVVNAGTGYKAKTTITAGAFNIAQWDTIATSGNFEPPVTLGTTSQYWRGDKSWQTLDKNAVGLSQVDNTSDANKPVSTAQAAADALKANIASPTLTGTPASTTPTVGDNSTRIATTAYVIGSFAPIASPVFTGNPQAPTPTPGDNDLSIATTAFVTAAIGNKPNDAVSDGQTYGRKNAVWVDVAEEAPADSITYGRKNGAWVASIGGAYVGDDPPGAPLVSGQLWYEADSGNTFCWVDNSWVQVNVMPATGSSPVATAQTRNRVVNGAMQISQENGSTESASPHSYWPADQWSISTPGTTNAKMLAVRLSNIPTPYGSVNRLRLRTNAVVVPTGGEFVSWYQPIEGIKIADFQWGTANAKQAVLRFGFRGPAATYSISIRNSDATLGYAQTFTISAGQADIDTEQLFVIPAPTTGTFANDTGKGIQIYVTLCSGTTYTVAPGSWTAANVVGATGMTNSLPNGAFFYLFDVGLYLDPQNTGVAPAWQMPDEAQELQACQRYYHKITVSAASVPFGSGYMQNTTNARSVISLSPPMRVPGSVSFSAPGDFTFCHSGGIVASAITLVGAVSEAFTCDATIATTTADRGGYLRSTNANAAISLNARM